MLYQRRADTLTAYKVTAAADAAAVLGWEVADPRPGDGWRVVLPLDGMALELSGQVGDYLAADGSGWRVIPAADFDREWMPPPADWAAQADAIIAAADGSPRSPPTWTPPRWPSGSWLPCVA